MYIINRQLTREYVYFLSLVENSGAKDFIITYIYLRIITFFIKIWIWYCIIFRVSFTGSKFSGTRKTIITFNNKSPIILKTYVHYLRLRFLDLWTENKNVKKGVHIFTKIKNTDGWKYEKKFFLVVSFQKFLVFPICTFSENAQCFVGAFL